jgi:predicted RNA-binding Zn ribbon-like protein
VDDLAIDLINGELDPGRRLTAGERHALDELAALLRRLTETVASGAELSGEELAEFNAVIGRTPVVARIEPGGRGRYVLDLTPVGGSELDRLLRESAGSFGSILRRAPDRLKLCENPDCRRAFFDRTKNRGRRWCDSGTCGNRARVRRHRARSRNARRTSR